jgi:hypothetical protein
MGLFRRRRERLLQPVEYVDDVLPRWFDVVSDDLAEFAAQDIELAQQFFEYLNQLPAEALWNVRYQVRPYVDALAPIIDKYERARISVASQSHLFTQGWLLARTEGELRYARPGKATRAAKVAILYLCDASEFGSPPPLGVRQLIEAGYYAYRHWPPEAPIRPPAETLATYVGTGALLSRSDRDAETQRAEQDDRGRAWLKERAAEKERRQLEWMLRESRDDED